MNEDGPPQQSFSSGPSRTIPPAPPRPFILPPAPPADLKPIANWIWITAVLVVVLLVVLAIPAVRSMREQTRLTSIAVASLHTSMTKGDDAGIFAAADASYQQQVGREKSDKLFDFVRARLGAPHDSKLMSTYVSSDAKVGQVLTLRYRTTFDKGPGTESIKLHKAGGTYLMLGYYVHSPRMNVKDIPADLQSK
jgi:hypothetical protein